MVNVIAAAGYLLLLVIKLACALTYARRYPKPAIVSRMHDVAVLQPILSGDPGLAGALEDNVRELPEATFFWLVDEDDPLAVEVTRGIAARFPALRIVIQVLPTAPDGVNPKLFKLEATWRQVTSPVCLVLDDDTRLPRTSLNALVEALDKAEVSTGLPYYRQSGGFPARLLAQFVNDNAALTYLPLLMFKPPVSINGMCYAIKKETLAELGGFEPLLRHLTDDLAVARYVRQRGGRLRQTPFPQEVETNVRSLTHYVQQMHRWFFFATLLVRSEPPQSAFLIGLLQGIHPLLLWIVLVAALLAPTVWTVGALLLLVVVRTAALSVIQHRLSGKVRFSLPLSLLSELLQPLHLLHAVCVRSIHWRRRYYHVYDNHRFEAR